LRESVLNRSVLDKLAKMCKTGTAAIVYGAFMCIRFAAPPDKHGAKRVNHAFMGKRVPFLNVDVTPSIGHVDWQT
jgi:hypothetical protein